MSNRGGLAAEAGLEPTMSESKSLVLPLHHSAIKRKRQGTTVYTIYNYLLIIKKKTVKRKTRLRGFSAGVRIKNSNYIINIKYI